MPYLLIKLWQNYLITLKNQAVIDPAGTNNNMIMPFKRIIITLLFKSGGTN